MPDVPTIPVPDHVLIVIMENHGYDEIIGNPDAPFINQLAACYGVTETNVSYIYRRKSWKHL